MNSAACRAAGQTGRGSPEKRQPTRNATSSGKRGSARVRATAMTCAELGRMVGRTEVNATPGVNLRPLFITVPSNLGRHRKLRRNTMSHWYEKFAERGGRGMTPKEYSELALRTAAGRNYPLNMYEAGMGIGGEGGEIVDIIKKIAFYNKDIDKDHIKEELGDLLWYVNLMLHSIGATWEEVFDLNIAKLEARYPDLRFNADHAINRDVNAEQKAMFAKALNEGNESTNHSWVDAEDEAASMSTGELI